MRTIGYIPPRPHPIPAPPDPPKVAENAPQETVPVEAPPAADDEKPVEKPAKRPGKGEKQDG
mgnify:CR=1 FL=1